MKQRIELIKKYRMQKKQLRKQLTKAKKDKNKSRISEIKALLIRLRVSYQNDKKALKNKKPIKHISPKHLVKQKYKAAKKTLKLHLANAVKHNEKTKINQIKKQLIDAKRNYRKTIKGLKPKIKNKIIKVLSKKQLIKKDYLAHKKTLKLNLASAKQQNNKQRIKQIKQELKSLKLKFKANKLALCKRAPMSKEAKIHNFTVVSFTFSITTLFILIIFALVGATNTIPWLQMIIANGSLTVFGIVFILLLVLVVGLLISSLSFYVLTHEHNIKRDSKK